MNLNQNLRTSLNPNTPNPIHSGTTSIRGCNSSLRVPRQRPRNLAQMSTAELGRPSPQICVRRNGGVEGCRGWCLALDPCSYLYESCSFYSTHIYPWVFLELITSYDSAYKHSSTSRQASVTRVLRHESFLSLMPLAA